MGVHRFPHEALAHFRDLPGHQKWLRDNYMILHLKGIIDDWLEEYPAIASKIEEAGFTRTVCRKSQKKKRMAFLRWLRTQRFPATGHTPASIWEIFTRALQWRTSTLLP